MSFAQIKDSKDLLKDFRKEFYIPQKNGKDTIYFCGNSLGLQAKNVRTEIEKELDKWAKLGVEGHFEGQNAWLSYHRLLTKTSAELVGAKPEEVVLMNNLTSNLHLLLISFYQPKGTKYKVLMEGGAFPSDQYAVESQVRLRGFDPENAIVEIFPRPNEFVLRTEDILQKIEEIGENLALVFFGGVNYYTGQAFDMQAISKKTHQFGAKVGFDLAHAIGNISLDLHAWRVDFAVWCTYKYLNSGAGGVGGAFVNKKYAEQTDLQRLAGWWGHKEEERFQMKKGFKPMYGAEGWQLSNAAILSMASHKASLELFERAKMENLIAKSQELTAYLEFLIEDFNASQQKINLKIITPKNPKQRGAQLSLLVENGKNLFHFLTENGMVVDWREPNVIRLAPVPLYNSFEDIFRFYEVLKKF